MSAIDVLILAVLAGSVLYGLKVGLIKQLGSIAGIVLGVLSARIMGDVVGSVLGSLLPDSFAGSESGRYAIGLTGRVTVFAVVYSVTLMLARSVRTLAGLLLMGPLDRALGAVLSMVQWFVALSIVLNVYMAINPDSKFFEQSGLAGGLAIDAVMSLAPALLGSSYAPWLG